MIHLPSEHKIKIPDIWYKLGILFYFSCDLHTVLSDVYNTAHKSHNMTVWWFSMQISLSAYGYFDLL